MNEFNEFVNVDSPTAGSEWVSMTEKERLLRVVRELDKHGYLDQIDVLAAHPDGNIIFDLTEDMAAGKRGALLLDIEEHLKQSLDPGISVWLEPRSDKSKLRNLRGIQVKT